MNLEDRVVIVTGGGGGLGRALCRGFVEAGARGVVVADIDSARAQEVASQVGGLAVESDVTSEAGIQRAVEAARKEFGRVDVFFSNAGLGGRTGVFSPDEDWEREWRAHAMSNVWAARAVLPEMLDRGEGYLISTASAVALTSQPDTGAYVVTKHANLALAEWLSLTYHDRGIRVSCVCPLGMRTDMLTKSSDDAIAKFGRETLMETSDAARVIFDGMRDERFLILTHPEVQTYYQRKASDHDRWLSGMRRLYARIESGER